MAIGASLFHRAVRSAGLAIALLCPAAAAGAQVGDAGAAAPRERVVLLHGLARGAGSMAPLAERLRAAGFETHNLDYSSTRHTPPELVAWLDAAIARCCAGGDAPVHFVTHSLGGILVRARLADARPVSLGRVVLIAPPNKGSEIVDAIGDNPLLEGLLGPTAVRLGTEDGSFPRSLGPPDYEVGIIAGSSSINPIGSALVPGPDDGTVSIESTRLEGASDFIVVEASHTLIMQDAGVARQVIHFLRRGRFERSAEAPDAGPGDG